MGFVRFADYGVNLLQPTGSTTFGISYDRRLVASRVLEGEAVTHPSCYSGAILYVGTDIVIIVFLHTWHSALSLSLSSARPPSANWAVRAALAFSDRVTGAHHLGHIETGSR